MKLTGNAETAAQRIVEQFKTGDVPAALAQMFIKRNDDIPCRRWSWNNQFIVAIMGHSDARGFQQWLEVGRCVRKGEKSFFILAPNTRTVDDEKNPGKKKTIITGFRASPVFGMSQTDIVDADKWAQHEALDVEAKSFLDNLPLREVAEAWGLSVESFSGRESGALGMYRHGRSIAIGVQNLSTWAHELIHAADDKLGNLTERGQHWRSEIVAEMGGAVLLLACGFEREADIGGAWEYINKYASAAGIDAVDACLKVLKRICDAVKMIIETAENLSLVEA